MAGKKSSCTYACIHRALSARALCVPSGEEVVGESGEDAVREDEEEVEESIASRGDSSRNHQRPAEAMRWILWQLDLPNEKIAGSLQSGAQGLWLLDLGEYESIIRQDLDLSTKAHLRLEVEGTDAVVEQSVDLLQVISS